MHALRTLRLLPAAASGRGLAGRHGAGDLAGDAGRQHQALRAAVRAVGRGDPRAPERGGAAPWRRNILARSGVSRERPVEPRLAVDLGEPGRRLLPHRSLPQRRGRDEAVRFDKRHRGSGLRPPLDLQETGPRARRQGGPAMVLGASKALVHRPRGGACAAQALVPEMDRADCGDLPPERCAAGALRPRSPSRTTVADVRCGARQAEEGGRRAVRSRRSGTGRTDGQGAQGQAAAIARETPRGIMRLRRQAVRAHGQQPRRARPARGCHRAAIELQLRQRERRRVHRDHVLGGRQAGDQRHRRPAPAGGMADRVRAERRQAAARPLARAAVVDERGAPARVHGPRRNDRHDRVPLLRARLHRRGNGAAARADRWSSAAHPPPPCRESSAGASAGSSPTAASRT